MSRTLFLILLIAANVQAQDWPQWGRTAQHDGATSAAGNRLDRIEARLVVDPFAGAERAETGGFLIVHYPVPLVDGNDLYLLEKVGVYTGRASRYTQTWSVKNVRRTDAGYVTRWTTSSDWIPVPSGALVG